MSKSDTDVAIDLINKQLDTLNEFNSASLVTTSNIINRLEKLEWFKMTTTQDIDEINGWIEFQDQNDYKKYETPTKIEDAFADNVKNKIIRNFLELNKEMADEDVERLRTIPIHKLQDFEKEDLDDQEQVYWACKILLDYIGTEDLYED